MEVGRGHSVGTVSWPVRAGLDQPARTPMALGCLGAVLTAAMRRRSAGRHRTKIDPRWSHEGVSDTV